MEGNDFNFSGLENDDFLVELEGNDELKRSQVFFALLVDGVPGDPGFGVGMSELVGELNTGKMRDRIEQKCSDILIDLVPGVAFKGVVVDQIKEQQVIGVDIHLTDTEVKEDFVIPVGF